MYWLKQEALTSNFTSYDHWSVNLRVAECCHCPSPFVDAVQKRPCKAFFPNAKFISGRDWMRLRWAKNSREYWEYYLEVGLASCCAGALNGQCLHNNWAFFFSPEAECLKNLLCKLEARQNAASLASRRHPVRSTRVPRVEGASL